MICVGQILQHKIHSHCYLLLSSTLNYVKSSNMYILMVFIVNYYIILKSPRYYVTKACRFKCGNLCKAWSNGRSIFDEQSTVLFIMQNVTKCLPQRPKLITIIVLYDIKQVHNKLIKPKYLLNHAMCNGARIWFEFDFNLLLLF